MLRTRTLMLAAALVTAALHPPAAAAADPTVEVLPGPATGTTTAIPLSPSELRSVAVRERQAARIAASSPTASDGSVTTALCPTTATTASRLNSDAGSATFATLDARSTTVESRIQAAAGSGSCVSDFVSIYARQQVKAYYCGPATVQQVINYTRGLFTTNNSINSFTQQQISDWWLKTDLYGGTSPYMERVGMNAGSRLPAGFTYYEYQVVSGADWHSKIITDVTGWNMPLTAAVAPHDIGFDFFLSSWANFKPVNTGHWIVMRGYYGKWDGTRNPLVYYTDSSGGLGGSTGRFYDPSFDVYQTLIKTNAVHRQGKWIVW
ncbi:MAG TPA: hypothetical protein VFM19_06615 [Candidatus Limnocylindria bacterium]|nr:hypothetical protein [Candidatus Limnocylindria bacterium]